MTHIHMEFTWSSTVPWGITKFVLRKITKNDNFFCTSYCFRILSEIKKKTAHIRGNTILPIVFHLELSYYHVYIVYIYMYLCCYVHLSEIEQIIIKNEIVK